MSAHTKPGTTATWMPSGRRLLLGAFVWTAFERPELLEICWSLTQPEVAAWLTATPPAGHRLTPDHLRRVLQWSGVSVTLPEVPEMPLATGDELLVAHPFEDPPEDTFHLYRLWRFVRTPH